MNLLYLRTKLLREEETCLFNDALNTFYLRLYGVVHMETDHSYSERGNHSRHMGYSIRLEANAPSHRQDSTYHSLCCTSRGAMV